MYLMNITKNEPNRARADLVTKKLRQFLYQNKLQALIIFFFLLISVFQRVVFCLLFLSTAKQRKVNNVKNAYINTVKCSGTLITYTIITILETSYYRTKQCVLIQYFKKKQTRKSAILNGALVCHTTQYGSMEGLLSLQFTSGVEVPQETSKQKSSVIHLQHQSPDSLELVQCCWIIFNMAYVYTEVK